VAKQAEIDQIKTHQSNRISRNAWVVAIGFGGLPSALPSSSTKGNYAKYLLSAKSLAAIFAIGESNICRESRAAADCGAPRHWLGTGVPGRFSAGETERTMAEAKAPAQRPLSPHLSIYKPMLTMMMSIVHRITGFGLYFGTLLVAWWLIAAASSPNAYAGIGSFMSSFFGRLILFGYTWALMHHMLGGIRHLIWDTGRGFGPQEREWLVAANLIGSIGLTIIIWIVGYLFMGGSR
jgi:succinate dehydrogenase / fumarate reductase cytochrome b subunit